MKPAFKQLLQIGIIVRDVDTSVKNFEEKLGMGPWEVSYMCNEGPCEDLKIDGKPFKGKVSKMAFLHRYGMEFELIEPIGDTPYKEWLDEHGPGTVSYTHLESPPLTNCSSPVPEGPDGYRYAEYKYRFAAQPPGHSVPQMPRSGDRL